MPENFEETGLLIVFFAVAGFMVYKSFSYGETAGLFPQLTGSVVLIGTALLLIQEFLPDRVQSVIGEPANLFSTSEDTERGRNDQPDTATESESEIRSDSGARNWVPDSVFTTASIVGYTVSSYYLGMLWMSPLFVFVYSRWHQQPWWATGILTAIAAGLAYGFMEVLNLSLAEGVLLERIVFFPQEVILWPL